jgi:hypothetical protein
MARQGLQRVATEARAATVTQSRVCSVSVQCACHCSVRICLTFTCANVIAVQVKEELVAPACCSGVGLGGEGNKDWDTFTNIIVEQKKVCPDRSAHGWSQRCGARGTYARYLEPVVPYNLNASAGAVSKHLEPETALPELLQKDIYGTESCGKGRGMRAISSLPVWA